jgi:hypothetical protein
VGWVLDGLPSASRKKLSGKLWGPERCCMGADCSAAPLSRPALPAPLTMCLPLPRLTFFTLHPFSAPLLLLLLPTLCSAQSLPCCRMTLRPA